MHSHAVIYKNPKIIRIAYYRVLKLPVQQKIKNIQKMQNSENYKQHCEIFTQIKKYKLFYSSKWNCHEQSLCL